MMRLVPIIIAAVIEAGAPGDFILRPDWADDAADVVPGSEDFYYELSAMKIPTRGLVWRNGVAITNESALPSVVPIADGFGYGYRGGNGPDDRATTNVTPIALNQFDYSWQVQPTNSFYASTYMYFLGTNAVDFALRKPLMFPKTARMDESTAAAVLSTYDACLERLYYASQGQSNAWDSSVWGPVDAGADFAFNPSNIYVHAAPHFEPEPRNFTNATHRLLEHRNLTNLIGRVMSMFPTEARMHDCDDYGEYKPPRYDHPAWLYRPGWIIDRCDRLTPVSGLESFAWWATTATPPLVPQLINGRFVTPSASEFALGPSWKEWRTFDTEADWRAVKWPLYAVTLDMPDRGHGFATSGGDATHPWDALFGQLQERGPSGYAYFRPYDWDCTLPEFVATNNPVMKRERLDDDEALSRYLDRYWGHPVFKASAATSRRLFSAPWAGVNNLLALMDRTIAIPFQLIDAERSSYTVYRDGTYDGGTINIKVEQDEETGELRVDPDSVPEQVNAILADTTTVVTNNYTTKGRTIYFSASAPHGASVSIGAWDTVNRYGVFLGSRAMRRIVTVERANPDVSHYVIFTSIAAVPEGILVEYLFDGDPDHGAVVEWEHLDMTLSDQSGTFPVPVLPVMHRHYDYDTTTAKTMLGPTHPGKDGEDRVKSAKFAALQKAETYREPAPGGESYSYQTRTYYRTSETDYADRDGLEDGVDEVTDALVQDQVDRAVEHFGVSPLNPSAFAPLPSSMTVFFADDPQFAVKGRSWHTVNPYPETYDIEKEYYVGYFPLTNDVWNVSNGVFNVSERVTDAEVTAQIVTYVTPDGWRFVTDAVTNVVSSTGSTNEWRDAVATVEQGEGEGTILSGEKWPSDPGYPVERTEYTNYTEFAADRVIENSLSHGSETNIVYYYDDHLQVTNATTNVVAIYYGSCVTNDSTVTIRSWQESRTYVEYRGDPTMVETRYWAFQVDKLLHVGGSGDDWYASYVYIDPVDGSVVPIDNASFPFLVGFVDIDAEILFRIDRVVYTLPARPVGEFRCTSTFKIMTQVDWDWKSMKLK